MSEVKEIKSGLKDLDDKYKKDIDNIEKQFSSFWFTKKISDELLKTINNHRNLQEPQVFWNWLINLYSSTITLEICKLIDKDKHNQNCGSLMELLESLKESKFLTEENFLNFYKANRIKITYHDERAREWDIKTLDDRVRKGYKETINENNSKNSNEMIEKDIETLKQSTKRIKEYRDTVIAHFDKKSLNEEYIKSFEFSTEQIDEIYLLIETLIQKYYYLIYPGTHLAPYDKAINNNNYGFNKIFKTEEV